MQVNGAGAAPKRQLPAALRARLKAKGILKVSGEATSGPLPVDFSCGVYAVVGKRFELVGVTCA